MDFCYLTAAAFEGIALYTALQPFNGHYAIAVIDGLEGLIFPTIAMRDEKEQVEKVWKVKV